MGAMLVVLLAVTAQPVGDSRYSPAASGGAAVSRLAQEAQLQGAKLRESVHDALRRWARPSDRQAEQAAKELLPLYRAVVADTQLPPTQRSELQSKLSGRLGRLQTQIQRQVAGPGERNSRGRPDTVRIPREKGLPLAQRGLPAAGQGGRPMMGGGPGGIGGMGGAGGIGPEAGANGAALVDLIQKTIAPPSWDVNGGAGSIRMW